MFTGIIEEAGKVLEAQDGFLRIDAPRVQEGTRLGDSVAINGVDLTVMEIDGSRLAFQVMPETYRRSNLAELRVGEVVNLERSVRPTDRLSGHIVRGVVEGQGRVQTLKSEGEAIVITYEAPPDLLQYIVVKGPVCIDGASLTVIDKTERTFSVSLVQYTQQNTNHAKRGPGDTVNLETDIVARYVGALLESRGVLPSSREDP